MFDKNSVGRFFSKDIGYKLLGAGKGLARVLDEPVVHAGLSAVAPGFGAGLDAIKRTGLLEKVKNA